MKKISALSTLVVLSIFIAACGDQAANNSTNRPANNSNTAVLVNSNAVNNAGTMSTPSANVNAASNAASATEHGLPTPAPGAKGLPTPGAGTNGNYNTNTNTNK